MKVLARAEITYAELLCKQCVSVTYGTFVLIESGLVLFIKFDLLYAGSVCEASSAAATC